MCVDLSVSSQPSRTGTHHKSQVKFHFFVKMVVVVVKINVVVVVVVVVAAAAETNR